MPKKKMETTGIIGFTSGSYKELKGIIEGYTGIEGYIGIMEKKMEATRDWGLGFGVKDLGGLGFGILWFRVYGLGFKV